MNTRLPVLLRSADHGYVYVAKREGIYKIGFSRRSVARRVRDSGGVLVLTIPTGQMPSELEYAINRRFQAKRLPSQGNQPGDKREWFKLDEADIDWLRGLAVHLNHNPLRSESHLLEVLNLQPVVPASTPSSAR